VVAFADGDEQPIAAPSAAVTTTMSSVRVCMVEALKKRPWWRRGRGATGRVRSV
jgi:hypothetical protein